MYFSRKTPISFERIEYRGYDFRYDGHRRSMVRRIDVCKIFDVKKDYSNVPVVRIIVDDVAPFQ